MPSAPKLLSSWKICVVATPAAFHAIQVSTVVAAHCTSPEAMARWRSFCGIFLIVTSRPRFLNRPASLASVSGAKPVQPEIAIVTGCFLGLRTEGEGGDGEGDEGLEGHSVLLGVE